MSYTLREHTADVAVAANAPTLSALFDAVADGLAAASAETIPDAGDRFRISVRAESREAVLFDFLDQLIYERDVRLVLPADVHSTVDHDPASDANEGEWSVTATARGVPLSDVSAREITAVTYSEMTLERRDGGWYAYVVFDV